MVRKTREPHPAPGTLLGLWEDPHASPQALHLQHANQERVGHAEFRDCLEMKSKKNS
jgi:hypothetical protein